MTSVSLTRRAASVSVADIRKAWTRLQPQIIKALTPIAYVGPWAAFIASIAEADRLAVALYCITIPALLAVGHYNKPKSSTLKTSGK